MGKIFISYRRNDATGTTRLLSDKLKGVFGSDDVFWDRGSIQVSEDFHRKIDDNIAKCSVLLAVIGPRWLDARHDDGRRRLDCDDDFVRLEVAAGLRGTTAVIPVLVDGSSMPTADRLPDDLKPLVRRNMAQLTDDHWEVGLQALIDAVRGLLDAEKAAAYQADATEAWRDGQVSPLERKTLEQRRDKLGLTPAQAAAIEQPLEDYQRRLADYRGDVALALGGTFVLGLQQRDELAGRRVALELLEDDTRRIDQELIAEAEKAHRAQQRAAKAAKPPAPAATAGPAATPAAAPRPAAAQPPRPAPPLQAPNFVLIPEPDTTEAPAPIAPPPAPARPQVVPAAAPPPPPSVALNAAKAVAGGTAAVVAGTAFLALDGATGLLRLAAWLLTTMLPGALVLLAMLAMGPLASFWMPHAFYAWMGTATDLGILALLLASVATVVGGTWFFQTDEFITQASEVLLPAAKGALLTAVVVYSLAGGGAGDAWPLVAGLGMAVHWLTLWVCRVFDL